MNVFDIDLKLKSLQIQIDEIKKHVESLKKEEFINKVVKEVTDAAESYYKLKKGIVYTKTGKRAVVDARRISIILIRAKTGLSSNNTGLFFLLDHASVLYSEKVMRDLFHNNTVIHNDIINICHNLNLDDETITKIFSYDNNRKNSARSRNRNANSGIVSK